MKRIEFVLCLFFISTVSFAQKEIAPTKNLDAYIGTWMYQSNDTIFKIVLKKGYAEDQHMIINGLMGGYFLSVKGIIVENYFRFLSVRLNRLKNKLLANYLRNRGNDLATVRNSAFCVAILSNNSFICKYNIFFRKYELSVAIL